MNNKVLELAQQVDIIKRPNMFGLGWDYTISEHQLEKFAELIVKECLSNMNDYSADLDFAVWKTKSDFGVE